MTDTEMLNLIEHYKWQIEFTNSKCRVVLKEAGTFALADNIRDAIKLALEKQAKWSIG